ncbi:hypothetical protein JW960_15140, partial [candidate division KSB1 bacterium]|nr:hypothetical protein [candidate division KSB1 bacterium]
MLSIRTTLFLLIIISFSFPIIVLSDPPQENARIPLKENFENSLRYVWLNKKVYDLQVIHSMENLSNWSTEGVCKIELTNDRSI